MIVPNDTPCTDCRRRYATAITADDRQPARPVCPDCAGKALQQR